MIQLTISVLDATLPARLVLVLITHNAMNVMRDMFKLTRILVTQSAFPKTLILLMTLFVNVCFKYLISNSKFLACDRACKACFGPNITDCTECYAPYYLVPGTTECAYNHTLDMIM